MKKKRRESLKHIFLILLIAFGVISFWRGIWQMSNVYLFPSSPLLSNSISIVVGITILYFTKHLIDLE